MRVYVSCCICSCVYMRACVCLCALRMSNGEVVTRPLIVIDLSIRRLHAVQFLRYMGTLTCR